MSSATVTSKGQITIPKEVRDDLRLEPGARITFTRRSNGDYVITREPKSVRRLRGVISYEGPPVDVDAMNDSIAAAAAESLT